MAGPRTHSVPLRDECAHVYTRSIGPYEKCTRCGLVVAVGGPTYNPNCPDCEFETHRCGRCGQQLDHRMTHNCPKAYG